MGISPGCKPLISGTPGDFAVIDGKPFFAGPSTPLFFSCCPAHPAAAIAIISKTASRNNPLPAAAALSDRLIEAVPFIVKILGPSSQHVPDPINASLTGLIFNRQKVPADSLRLCA
jgi:hypothetical protein